MYNEYAFLANSGIPTEALDRACTEAQATGILPHWRLITSGVLSPQRYLELLEAEITLRYPRAQGRLTEIVDGLSERPSAIAVSVARIRAQGNAPLFLMRQQIDWSELPHSRWLRADLAANALQRRFPELSAATPFSTWQLLSIPVLTGIALGALLIMPQSTLKVLTGLVCIPFLAIVLLRAWALAVFARQAPLQHTFERLPDHELPTYTVMVPLFREANIVADTVAALRRLDYPSERLDILLILESIDTETETALRAVPLPPHIRVIVVPDQQPRTKPKALNYALRLSRGDYVVVYDAEDDPDPDQLHRAAFAFRHASPDTMCLQARLQIDNPEHKLLARQFILEYAALFDGMLPALAHLGLPIPLGGTSNHFPRRILEDLGGWDAWNVTEDADLGLRIARRGGRVRVLASITYEEAPDTLQIWLPQRTRWLKGFMQTWLVHMRQPTRLLREMGMWQFLGFNAYLGGIVLSALVHPLFVGLLIYEAATGSLLSPPDSVLGITVMVLALFNLAGGYACGIGIAAIATHRRKLKGMWPHLALMPVYWLLVSLAAYRAATQLFTHPYLWEKTPHRARQNPSRSVPPRHQTLPTNNGRQSR